MTDHLPISLSLHDEQGLAVDTERLRDVGAPGGKPPRGPREKSPSTLVDAVPHCRAERASIWASTVPTDVLSFPVDGLVTSPPGEGEPPVLIGDIVLCPEVPPSPRPPPVPTASHPELDLLITHGVLHLLGYDHDSEEAAACHAQPRGGGLRTFGGSGLVNRAGWELVGGCAVDGVCLLRLGLGERG